MREALSEAEAEFLCSLGLGLHLRHRLHECKILCRGLLLLLQRLNEAGTQQLSILMVYIGFGMMSEPLRKVLDVVRCFSDVLSFFDCGPEDRSGNC